MFYSGAFDPWKIILQMIGMQCGYYIVLGFAFLAANIMHDRPVSTSHLFSAKHLDESTGIWSAAFLAHLLTAFGMAVLLRHIVQRAKKCLDFGCTAYSFAILATLVYDGELPTTWIYWLVQLMCIIISVSLGEFLCMRKEMEEIPIGYFNSGTVSTGPSGSGGTARSPGGSPLTPS